MLTIHHAKSVWYQVLSRLVLRIITASSDGRGHQGRDYSPENGVKGPYRRVPCDKEEK